mgnify:CR=1 FL=1
MAGREGKERLQKVLAEAGLGDHDLAEPVSGRETSFDFDLHGDGRSQRVYALTTEPDGLVYLAWQDAGSPTQNETSPGRVRGN